MATFKAWAYTTTDGGLENNLHLIDRSEPSWVKNPPKGKYAVEVLCASLNPVDYKLPESPIESRVARIPKPATPGLDFCGRLVSQPDRVVCGKLAWPVAHGTLGKYVLVSDNDFADIPQCCDSAESAAIPIAALTAYQSIVPHIEERKSTQDPIARVVIFGGSGGVGIFSIQIAKIFNCYVVTTCSGRSKESLCRILKADEVIDYTKEDVVASLESKGPFDLAIDNTGADPTLHKRSAAFLKPGARFVLVSAMLSSAEGILSMMDSLLRPRWLGGAPNPYSIVLCQPNKRHLERIISWINAGRIEVHVGEMFEFNDAPKALARLRSREAGGKIVVMGEGYSADPRRDPLYDPDRGVPFYKHRGP